MAMGWFMENKHLGSTSLVIRVTAAVAILAHLPSTLIGFVVLSKGACNCSACMHTRYLADAHALLMIPCGRSRWQASAMNRFST